MPESQTTRPDEGRKVESRTPQPSPPGFEELPFSPSNPPDLHSKPLIKNRIDREGLRKALERAGIDPNE
jgi:hypothetical protein